MRKTPSEVEDAVTAISEKLDLPNVKLTDEYSYPSLPLCVVDAVFAAALGEPEVAPDRARHVIEGACELLRQDFPHLTPRLLDNAIWKYQRAHRTKAMRLSAASACGAPIR